MLLVTLAGLLLLALYLYSCTSPTWTVAVAYLPLARHPNAAVDSPDQDWADELVMSLEVDAEWDLMHLGAMVEDAWETMAPLTQRCPVLTLPTREARPIHVSLAA